MAWNRKTNTRISSKNVIANPVGVKQSIAVLSITLLFAACGGDSGSGAKGSEPAEGANDGREVATLVDMGRCTSEREGDTVYVAEKLTDYLCKNNSWVDLSEVSSDMSSGKADSNTTSSSSKGTGSTDETDPSSSDSDTDVPEGYVRENISVTGVAQKGPFKFGSPLNLYELKKNLTPSGTVYKDEISSNKGDFVIPKVSLAYPYAKLEVRGLYRNEVTGEWSADSMTLRALTDFSEERTDVNINLLTHLEYDRALYLVQEKGYSIYAAKKQAAQEIMTAFEFATAVTYSEDFAIFQNEGVSATTSAGNATLLAISALVMGNRSDAEIQNTIDKFIADIKTDGEWNDLQTKAGMADWAYDFNYSTIKASVKSWNILDIPAYETYLDIYWNNVYGLGGCSVNRKDVVAPNSNKLSKNYNKYFICNGSQWDPATTFQKDAYEWATGKTGEFKKGNVTDTIYIYNGTKWEVSERETAIGLCGTSNAEVVSEFENVYYICRNNAWMEATALEYDTYEKVCNTDGSIVDGEIISTNKYVCDAGVFRNASDEEISLDKGCVSYTEGNEIRKQLSVAQDSVYLCSDGLWNGSIENVEGDLFDSRDGKAYRTVTIGSQTWMAENLNYSDSEAYVGMKGHSWCYDNEADSCTKYGRLYTWAAAMDSVGKWSMNGKNCGNGKFCTPTYPVRGICPEGWHIPTREEWNTLYTIMGSPYAMQAKGYWGDPKDTYGFAALPAGAYYNGSSSGVGSYANFWSATEGNSYRAFYWYLDAGDAGLEGYYGSYGKNYGRSVRCLKDPP